MSTVQVRVLADAPSPHPAEKLRVIDKQPVFRAFNVREIRSDKREADFVCSTDATDTYGTRLDQASWQLERFKNNPVILFGHQTYELPIGQARKVAVENGQLVATIWFTETTERAQKVWAQVEEKTLRGVSVGFIPHSYHFEKEKDEEYLVLSDNELVEISICPVPSNPEALAKIRARAIAERQTPPASPDRPALVPVDNTSAATRGAGDHMDPKELEKQIGELRLSNAEMKARTEKAETERSATQANLDTVEKQRAVFEVQNKRLVEERDAAVTRAQAAEKQLIELEVGALVGRKIKPTEKDTFIKLRSSDKSLFDEMVAQRGDMPHETQVIPSEAKPPAVTERAPDTSDAAAAAAFNAEFAKSN